MTDESTAVQELTRRRGQEEETAVRTVLTAFCNTLPSPAYTTPEAVLIPTSAGYAEIDAMVICSGGIFVFECKHMKGTVLGRPNDRMWTKTGESVLSFPNPILQSRRHADAAATFFGVGWNTCFSYVVFNDRCKVEDAESSVQILRTSTLAESLKPQLTASRLNNSELCRVIEKAGKLSTDEKTREKHTANINRVKKEKRVEKKRRY